MVTVVWTEFAIHDLNEIGEYIANDSERYAKNVVQNLFGSTDILESHPKVGRIVPEFNNRNIRELVRGSYRIVYRVRNNIRIDVLTVHHSSRLLTKSILSSKKSTPGSRK